MGLLINYSCVALALFTVLSINSLIRNRDDSFKEMIFRILLNAVMCMLGFLASIGVMYIFDII